MIYAFDLFGTVFDMSAVPHEAVKSYTDQLKRPVWAPLLLPAEWEELPAFGDSAEGLRMLREAGHWVVTCSNAPLGLQARLSRNAGIVWDCMVPLELSRAYKTNPRAYMTVCEVLTAYPHQVTMVTANEKFGDIEAARALGMNAVLIRGSSGPRDIIELARL